MNVEVACNGRSSVAVLFGAITDMVATNIWQIGAIAASFGPSAECDQTERDYYHIPSFNLSTQPRLVLLGFPLFSSSFCLVVSAAFSCKNNL
jgi:hypothetical protein